MNILYRGLLKSHNTLFYISIKCQAQTWVYCSCSIKAACCLFFVVFIAMYTICCLCEIVWFKFLASYFQTICSSFIFKFYYYKIFCCFHNFWCASINTNKKIIKQTKCKQRTTKMYATDMRKYEPKFSHSPIKYSTT